MIFQHEPGVSHGLNSTSFPLHCLSGYQVQFRDQDTNHWRVYASFEFYGEAEACLIQLQSRGIEAQLDSNRACRSRT
jgi:hypothetical protein